jgi:hypothetical protein
MAILRKAVVVLIALTVAGMLPAARSMPVDGANAACAVHAGTTEDCHCEPSIACGAACALCATADNASRGGVVVTAPLPVLSAPFGAPGLTHAPETAPPKLLLT